MQSFPWNISYVCVSRSTICQFFGKFCVCTKWMFSLTENMYLIHVGWKHYFLDGHYKVLCISPSFLELLVFKENSQGKKFTNIYIVSNNHFSWPIFALIVNRIVLGTFFVLLETMTVMSLNPKNYCYLRLKLLFLLSPTKIQKSLFREVNVAQESWVPS